MCPAVLYRIRSDSDSTSGSGGDSDRVVVVSTVLASDYNARI